MNAAILLLLAFVAGACSDSDTTKTVDNGRRYGDATVLQVLDDNESDVSTMSFSLGASSKIVGINCDGDWKATVDAEWVTLSNYSGYGFANKYSYDKITVEKNKGSERTATVTFTSGSISKQLAITQKGAGGDPDDPFETSFELIENLKMGYNLGNTLDANADPAQSWFNPTGPGDWEAYETVWGQPVTTQEIIDYIVSKGFNIIRVPVTWFPHVDENWNINETWMNRVQAVVDMVLSTGSYCIINVMHDTGARDASRTDNQCWLNADPDKYEANTVIYQKLWTQIATRFRNYDDRLIFESFNEILDKNYSWTAPAEGDEAYTVINKLQQDFVNTVRATGGNNSYRNLAITTYSATGNSDAAVNSFQLPDDVASNHIYLSIHSYDPYNFCNNNSGKNADGTEYDYNQEIFDSDCQGTIDAVFARVSKRANEVGIPFIFGEFGAIDAGKALAERIKYAKYLKSKYTQYETAGLWWMGLIDRKTLTTNVPYDGMTVDESEIIDALMK